MVLAAFGNAGPDCAAGCGKRPAYPEGTVIGTVTVDGVPARGAVTFSPAVNGQGPVVGATIVDGKFRCEHVPLGGSNVTFTLQAAELQRDSSMPWGPERQVPINLLPPQYNRGVPAEIHAGDNPIEFRADQRCRAEVARVRGASKAIGATLSR